MKSTIGTARSTNSFLDVRKTEVEVIADEVDKVGGRQAIENLPDGDWANTDAGFGNGN